jgi:hypothetical protein
MDPGDAGVSGSAPTAPSLWDTFDGETFEPVRDGSRLGRQLLCVRSRLIDGQWHTLAELSETCEASEASVSARIRDLRKRRFGSHEIEHEYVTRGLWRYRMVIAPRA